MENASRHWLFAYAAAALLAVFSSFAWPQLGGKLGFVMLFAAPLLTLGICTLLVGRARTLSEQLAGTGVFVAVYFTVLWLAMLVASRLA